MKRAAWVRRGFIFFTILSLLAGCSSPTSENQGNTAAPQSADGSGGGLSGEIKVAAWNDAADALEAEIPGFNQKYPNVKVTIQRVTNNYEQIIPSLTAGMGAPDIIQTQNRDFQSFLQKFPDQFVDLTDKLQSHKEEFAKTAWAGVEKDGKAYAVPWDLGPVGVWYRKDYFEQAGIDPKTLTTWDKFIEAGKQLQSKLGGKVKMTSLDHTATGDMDMWLMLMNQLGGSFTNANGEIDFTQDANIKAMEMTKRLKDEGITINTPTWDERIRAVVNGETATVVFPVWYAGTIRHQAKDQQGKWGVMPMPAFTEGGPNQANLGGSILAVTSQSKNQEAAWAFIEYSLLTNEGEDVQMKYGLFPSWTPYYQSENFKKNDEYFGFPLAEFFGEVSTNIPELKFPPEFLDLAKPIQDANGAVLSGKAGIEEAFKQAEQQASKASGLKIAP